MEKQSGFFKVSHALFENEKYKNMSLFAKILYGMTKIKGFTYIFP